MRIKDKIYGVATINSPVISELIRCKSIQRLKKIAQFGVPDKLYHKKGFSRYEHSIGVMVLLKKLGASEEEQIAGLLHDVSHAAFSHLIDWVMGNREMENYQDSKHKELMKSSEAFSILKRHRYDFRKISAYKKFKLLEREIPLLCADRIDYALREFQKPLAIRCFKNLAIKNNAIVFRNRGVARLFAENFLRLQREHWGGFEAISRYKLFSDLLSGALNKKVIKLTDFREDDDFILKKLENSKNRVVWRYLKILRRKSLAMLPKGKVVMHKKFRYVDPEFILGEKVIKLSGVDKKFKNEINKARENNSAGVIVPLAI